MQDDKYFDSDEFRDILRHYEECERKGVPCIIDTDSYADIAEYYADRGDDQKAIAALDNAISLYGNPTLPLVMKAKYLFSEQHDYNGAMVLLDMVEDKTDVEYILTMAEIMIIEEKDDDAEQLLNDRLETLDDDEREGYILDAAELYLDYYMPESAETWLQKFEDKDDPEYLEVAARMLMSEERYDEGEQILDRLIDNDPFSKTYWNTLASSQLLRGDVSGGITSSEYAIAIDPNDAEGVRNKAYGLLLLGNFEEALRYCQRLREIEPGNGIHLLLEAICHLRLKNVEAARASLRDAAGKQLPDIDRLHGIYNEIGYAFAVNGCIDDAIHYIDTAEDACPDEPGYVDVAHAQVYLENGDDEKAKDCMMEALRKSNDNPFIYIQIARVLCDYDILDLAYAILKVLVKAGDDDICMEAYPSLALCCYKMGRRREFASTVKRAASCNPELTKLTLGWLFPDGIEPADYHKHSKEIFN